MLNFIRLSAGAIAIAALSACGGGAAGSGGGTLPAPQASQAPLVPTVPPNTIEQLRVSLYVPGRYLPGTEPTSSHARRPQYLPLSVNSISFQQTLSGGTVVSPAAVVVTIGSISCVSSSGGQTCTATLVGALGSDQWTVKTYASTNGTGTALSIATLAKTIVSGTANVSNLTLNPIVASLAFVPTGSSCNAALTCTPSLVLNALDTAGATIVGPGLFVNASNTATPLTLTAQTSLTGQTSGGSAATTTLNQTSDNNLAKLAYDASLTGPTSKTLTASGSGLTSAVYTLTLTAGSITTNSPIAIGNTNSTTANISANEAGFTGTFSESDPGSTCAGIATIGASSGAGATETFLVTQVGGGTCSVVISDGHGGSSTVSIVSTTYSVILQ